MRSSSANSKSLRNEYSGSTAFALSIIIGRMNRFIRAGFGFREHYEFLQVLGRHRDCGAQKIASLASDP
jgi:hypothetical protein